MTLYRVGIPLLIEPVEGEHRILTDADQAPGAGKVGLMLNFEIRADSERAAALILYERLEGTCGD